MKILFFLMVLLFLFVFVFMQSNTWESRIVRVNKQGVEYLVTEQSLHWDRFFDYLKAIPYKVKDKFNQTFKHR